MEFVDEVLRLVRALNERGVAYVIIGGVAMNAHGIVRATEDLDLFIEASGRNVEALKLALGDVWADPSIDEISAVDLLGDYPAVRYGPPSGTIYLDILTRLGEFATFADLEAEVITIDDVPLRVATPRTLHWMKRGTVRVLDHDDAAKLAQKFKFEPRED